MDASPVTKTDATIATPMAINILTFHRTAIHFIRYSNSRKYLLEDSITPEFNDF